MLYEDATDKEIIEAAKDFIRNNGWREVVMIQLNKRIEWKDFDAEPPTLSTQVVQVHFHRFGEVDAEVLR